MKFVLFFLSVSSALMCNQNCAREFTVENLDSRIELIFEAIEDINISIAEVKSLVEDVKSSLGIFDLDACEQGLK